MLTRSSKSTKVLVRRVQGSLDLSPSRRSATSERETGQQPRQRMGVQIRTTNACATEGKGTACSGTIDCRSTCFTEAFNQRRRSITPLVHWLKELLADSFVSPSADRASSSQIWSSLYRFGNEIPISSLNHSRRPHSPYPRATGQGC